MLIGMIGAPASGKTTIAVKMFAQLKELGTKTEFIAEVARQYIAKVRYENNLPSNSVVELTDTDQLSIARKQYELERYMKHSCGPATLIISDSSVLNTRLYLSESASNPEVANFFKNAAQAYDLLFFCHPIDLKFLPDDPNRVHNLESIKVIQAKSLKLLDMIKMLKIPCFELIGAMPLEARCREAMTHALNKQIEFIARSDL